MASVFAAIDRKNPERGDASFTLFMDLPPELRGVVYNELWKESPKLYIPKGRINRGTFEIHYNTNKDKPIQHGLPQWLRTSKAILHEGLA